MPAFIKILFTTALLTTSVNTTLAQERSDSAAGKPILIQSQEMIVLVPQSREKLMAYSIEKNIWDQIDISVDQKQPIEPTVAQGMTACQLRQTIYAFAAKGGFWASLNLPPDFKTRFSINDQIVTVFAKTETEDRLYVFGANAASLSGVDLKTGKLLDVNEQKQDPAN
ncbi:MAG TPA: hypothetical protein DCM07_30885 [Planctomycetaceae bacterium]|nr:hypothetical protein [Planctomycetaceae bacterium]